VQRLREWPVVAAQRPCQCCRKHDAQATSQHGHGCAHSAATHRAQPADRPSVDNASLAVQARVPYPHRCIICVDRLCPLC
jgi:hypothetical protein